MHSWSTTIKNIISKFLDYNNFKYVGSPLNSNYHPYSVALFYFNWNILFTLSKVELLELNSLYVI